MGLQEKISEINMTASLQTTANKEVPKSVKGKVRSVAKVEPLRSKTVRK